VVHVISCPILPSGMQPQMRQRPAARPPVPQRVNGFAAPPQDRYRTGFLGVPTANASTGAVAPVGAWQVAGGPCAEPRPPQPSAPGIRMSYWIQSKIFSVLILTDSAATRV